VQSQSIIEAFSALLAYDPQESIKANLEAMEEAASGVKTGEITLAVRDSKSKVGKIKKDDYIGLFDHEIKVVCKSLRATAKALVNAMLDEDDETITLLSGADVSIKEAEDTKKAISKKYPDLEIELHAGGQPLYHLLIGLE